MVNTVQCTVYSVNRLEQQPVFRFPFFCPLIATISDYQRTTLWPVARQRVVRFQSAIQYVRHTMATIQYVDCSVYVIYYMNHSVWRPYSSVVRAPMIIRLIVKCGHFRSLTCVSFDSHLIKSLESHLIKSLESLFQQQQYLPTTLRPLRKCSVNGH